MGATSPSLTRRRPANTHTTGIESIPHNETIPSQSRASLNDVQLPALPRQNFFRSQISDNERRSRNAGAAVHAIELR